MRLIFALLISLTLTFAASSAPDNAAKADKKTAQEANKDTNESVKELLSKIDSVSGKLSNNNIWIKKYNDYLTYKRLSNEYDDMQDQIANMKRKKDKDSQWELSETVKKSDALKQQIVLLGDFRHSILGDLVAVEEIALPPSVNNPIAIFFALSYIKQLGGQKDIYSNKLDELEKTIGSLRQKKELILELRQLSSLSKDKNVKLESKRISAELDYLNNAIEDLQAEKKAFSDTVDIYSKKTNEQTQRLQGDIKRQLTKIFNIFIFIVVLFLLSLLAKVIAKKYVKENEKFYLTNKVINMVTVTIAILFVLFAYMENVEHIVTILGFASAGIAIALKDWFMSLLGWVAIMAGSIVKVGDRIRVQKDGLDILGDILDISLLRITLYEEVSLLSYEKNHRAGRIIFLPNNIIFTHPIMNYTHSGMQTVWDGINITVTFDSNIDMAIELAKESALKHCKTYSKMTDRQFVKLRSKYHMRNTSMEPRIFTLIENSGVVISVWYPTSSYYIMQVKSAVSYEILKAFRQCDEIKLAYNTSNIIIAENQSSLGFAGHK